MDKAESIVASAAAEANDDEHPNEVASEFSLVGRVIYEGVDGDFRVSKRWSVAPSVALLHVTGQEGGDSESHFYAGGALVYQWDDTLRFGAGVEGSPSSAGVSSWGGRVSFEKAWGADWDRDQPPRVELLAEMSAAHFSFASADGVSQYFLDSTVLFRVGRGWELSPQLMYFLYGRELQASTPEQADGLAVLARVGTYAPRALVGARIAYRVLPWIGPVIVGEHLEYAAGIGRADGAMVGLDLRWRDRFHFGALGGVLYNELSPQLNPDTASRTFPRGSVTVSFNW